MNQTCCRCVMDNTAPDIIFDNSGVCNFCKEYERRVSNELVTGLDAEKRLDALLTQIKQYGRGKEYDCLIGVSGGTDSTYVAHIVRKKLGLRPLALHVDNGWNSELALSNIERILTSLDIDLYTQVLDWDEFGDLQKSFLKASVGNAEIPTDHSIVAMMFKIAAKHDIKYILTGSNIVTEAIMPSSWMYDATDLRLIKGIHRKFGTRKLQTFPTISIAEFLYFTLVKDIKFIPILNFVPYVKEEAKKILQEEYGWRDYGGKHYESIYTRFFQAEILPKKFNIDKRKAHLSCLIMAGQITRDDALIELSQPADSPEQIEADKTYVIKKLGFSPDEYELMMNDTPKSHQDYPNSSFLWNSFRQVIQAIRRRAIAID